MERNNKIELEEIRLLVSKDSWHANLWERLKAAVSNATDVVYVKDLIDSSSPGSKNATVKLLKKLQEHRLGRFIPGRGAGKDKKQPKQSRFEPSPTLRLIVTQGFSEQGQPSQLSQDSTEITAEIVEHPFLLRPKVMATIRVPIDLKKSEADRLAEFIKTLPFGI